jgi:hypothetical protein
MTAWDAFGFSTREAAELEEQYSMAYDEAVRKSKWDTEVAENMLIELLAGLSDVEKKALALGIMVGRGSR